MTQASLCKPAAQPSQSHSLLRQRMIEDMRMRKFVEKTQVQYIRAVVRWTRFLGTSPDTATEEDLRRFQLHLVDHGATPQTLNVTISGLKFFFEITLNRPEVMAKMQPVKYPRKLPVVLSRDEVKRLKARRHSADGEHWACDFAEGGDGISCECRIQSVTHSDQ
jgi:integrase/recombinase XerD